MNIVDSCGWLEYYANGKNADFFAPVIIKTDELIVPAVTIYEVFKRVLQQSGEDAALQAISYMKMGRVVDLTSEIAVNAAYYSVKHALPFADSIIYATGLYYNCVIYTQDSHFASLKDVMYIEKLRIEN